MSCQKGNGSRTRTQKYTNSHAFKNDKYDKTRKTQMINSIQVCNVCEHCRGVIEWKIKYKKYKPLTAPKKCVKCEQKTIKHAYHMLCYPCAREQKVCPKCGKKSEIQPVEENKAKLDNEMQELLKSLPERKRRTFLRFLASKKAQEEAGEGTEDAAKASASGRSVKEELTAKLNELKLASKKDGSDDEFDSDDDFDSNDDDSDHCDSSEGEEK